MAESKGSPQPGSKEWQDQLNAEIADHDVQAKQSGNDNQTFEISKGDMVLTEPAPTVPRRRRTRGARARLLGMFTALVADVDSEPVVMPRLDAALAGVRIGGAGWL